MLLNKLERRKLQANTTKSCHSERFDLTSPDPLLSPPPREATTNARRASSQSRELQELRHEQSSGRLVPFLEMESLKAELHYQ